MTNGTRFLTVYKRYIVAGSLRRSAGSGILSGICQDELHGTFLVRACDSKSRIAGDKPVFILADAQALAIRDFAIMERKNYKQFAIEGITFHITQNSIIGIELDTDFDNPKLPRILKEAAIAAPIYIRIARLYEIYWEYVAGLYPLKEYELDRILRRYDYNQRLVIDAEADECQSLTEQSIVSVEDWMKQLADSLRAARALQRIRRKLKSEAKLESLVKVEKDDPGYIYILKATNSDLYKIGKTRDLNNRIRMFSVKLPFQVELLHTIQCKDYSKAELSLHAKYADKRENGEWFRLTETDIIAIKRIKRL